MSDSYNLSIEKEIRMGMNLIERDEFTATMKAISHIAAETVSKTLGPYAHTTIIDDGNFTYPTKDGWSILNRLRFQDPTHNSIFTTLKNISMRIVDKVGDGTTTAMVTADHFMNRLDAALSDGTRIQFRQADIVAALNEVRDMIIAQLEKDALQIVPDADIENPEFNEIYNIAYISSNGNAQLAKIMQTIYQKTRNPNVMVDKEGGKELSFDIQDGYRLECAFLKHERYINTSDKTYDSMNMPHMIVAFDHSVTYQKHAPMIDAFMQKAVREHMPLVIMAPYYDDVITAQITMLIQKELQERPNAIPGLMVIQIPELTRSIVKNAMNDFATLAGIFPISDTKVKIFTGLRHNDQTTEDIDKIHMAETEVDGYKFTTAQSLIDSCVGTITDFSIAKDYFILRDVDRTSRMYLERLEEAKREYEEAKQEAIKSPTSLMKRYMDANTRLNKLIGSMGTIHVGGLTDLERQCMADVVDDTFRACRSAYETGIVAGLNMGVLKAMNTIGKSSLPVLQKIALRVLIDAYRDTTYDILQNKYKCEGIDGEHVWKYGAMHLTHRELVEILERDMLEGKIICYDIVSETADAPNCEIPSVCNSVSTDIEILNGITSILGMVLTSDQYMSVSRMYDKIAAIRQQEALNERTAILNVKTTLKAIDEYLVANPQSNLAGLVQYFANPCGRFPRAILDCGNMESGSDHT